MDINNSSMSNNYDQNSKFHLNTDNNFSIKEKKFSQEKSQSISNSNKNKISLQILRIEKLRENENQFTRNQAKELMAYNTEFYANTSFNKSYTQSPNRIVNEENQKFKINFLKVNNIKRNADTNSYSNKIKSTDENKGNNDSYFIF